MRVFFTLFLILISFACAHQSAPHFVPAKTGLEKSVFPVYFTVGSYYSDNEYERILEPEYRACAAVYVAKNVMITSDTVFLSREQNTRGLVHLNRIALIDGSHQIKVKDITFYEKDGLTVIETRETGVPMKLRQEPVRADSPLSVIGYRFKRNPGWKARTLWKRGPVSVDKEWLETVGDESTFMADLELNHGLCGAPVLDAQNRLVGIVHRKYGQATASVISAKAIKRVLKEYYGDTPY